MDLSVITATRQRPALLLHCLEQFRIQEKGGLLSEQIVVSDGPDQMARSLCARYQVRYFELPRPAGQCGAFAKDRGILAARGTFVCFWDDDNVYYRHALSTLFAAASGADIGVVRTVHRLRRRPGLVTIPRRWQGAFVKGDIDTMCVCVKRTLACREHWGLDVPQVGTDYIWLRRLLAHHPRIRYVPSVIGIHA